LKNTTALESYNPLIEWAFFLDKMQVLEAQKRDKIPTETLMAWFNTLKSNSWTNEKLSKQVDVMLKSVTYGAVKIDDFFTVNEKFTAEETEIKIRQRIDGLIREGSRLLQGKEIEVDLLPISINVEAVNLAIAKRLKVYYNEETDFETKEIIDQTIIEVAERMGYKKIEHSKHHLTNSQKLKARLSF
jgi:hypothetical protein